MEKISVAVDFSDVMPYVLDETVKIARPAQAKVYLIHVIETTPAYGMYGFSPEEIPMVGPSSKELKEAARAKLKSQGDVLREQGIMVEEVVLEGNPLDEVLNFIKENNISMLVVGSHGRGILTSMFLGSVADGAIRRSHVPVLVVPYMKKS